MAGLRWYSPNKIPHVQQQPTWRPWGLYWNCTCGISHRNYNSRWEKIRKTCYSDYLFESRSIYFPLFSKPYVLSLFLLSYYSKSLLHSAGLNPLIWTASSSSFQTRKTFIFFWISNGRGEKGCKDLHTSIGARWIVVRSVGNNWISVRFQLPFEAFQNAKLLQYVSP